MVKYILILMLLLSAIQAKGFKTKYLSCTLVEETTNRTNVNYITERIAKSRNMYSIPIIIKETSFVMKEISLFGDSIDYLKTNGNGYDVYGSNLLNFKINAYYKPGVRLMIENINQENGYTRYYDCKKRQPTIKEKAEALKDKWF